MDEIVYDVELEGVAEEIEAAAEEIEVILDPDIGAEVIVVEYGPGIRPDEIEAHEETLDDRGEEIETRRAPEAREGHICVAYKDCIIIWGGYRESRDDDDAVANYYCPSNELWIFCPLTSTWYKRLCALNDDLEPPSISGTTAVVIQDYLYFFGGYSQRFIGSHNHLYRLSLENYVWERLNPEGPVPMAVDKLVSWTYSGKFYIFGGFATPSLNAPSAHNPHFHFVYDRFGWKGWTNQFYEYDPEENRWSVPQFQGVLPHARAAHAAAVVHDNVYIFGGRCGSKRTNDLHCLNMVDMQWTVKSISGPIPEGRSWHSLTGVSDSLLLLFGGFNDRHEVLGDCWIFDISFSKWDVVNLPFYMPRLWHSACLTSFDEVAIFGGCTTNILDNGRRAEQANDLIMLALTPRSLFRLCLKRVLEIPELSHQWSSLPHSIQDVLNAHCKSRSLNILTGL